MRASTISELVGSSQYQAVADDSLKDEDNAAWVMILEPKIREAWIQRISWIRLIDRIAESELIGTGNSKLGQFYAEWQHLLKTGEAQAQSSYQEMLTNIRTCWFTHTPSQADLLCIQSWNRYLKAIIRYHSRDLTIQSEADYKTMLHQLGGSLFQVLPFLPVSHWRSSGSLGALDQFFNHLRDMQEDAQQGICYLPTALLDCYGLDRRDILELQSVHHPNYRQMMQDWLGRSLQRLYRKAEPLISAENLHPSWQILRDWSLHRYRRIEQVFRECDFDYTRFPQVYWQQVQQELPDLLEQARHQQADLNHERRNHLRQDWSSITPSGNSEAIARSVPLPTWTAELQGVKTPLQFSSQSHQRSIYTKASA